jgi:hypothetical protein
MAKEKEVAAIQAMSLPKELWNTGLSPEYLTALGAVTALWGQFEMQFDSCIGIISRTPEATELSQHLPNSFKQRAKLMRKVARITFRQTPSLAQKLCDFSRRAQAVCLKRNELVHSIWFDHPFEDVVWLMTTADASGPAYSVPYDQVLSLCEKIQKLKIEGPRLTFPLVFLAEGLLTKEEQAALAEYHRLYPGPQLTAPSSGKKPKYPVWRA